MSVPDSLKRTIDQVDGELPAQVPFASGARGSHHDTASDNDEPGGDSIDTQSNNHDPRPRCLCDRLRLFDCFSDGPVTVAGTRGGTASAASASATQMQPRFAASSGLFDNTQADTLEQPQNAVPGPNPVCSLCDAQIMLDLQAEDSITAPAKVAWHRHKSYLESGYELLSQHLLSYPENSYVHTRLAILQHQLVRLLSDLNYAEDCLTYFLQPAGASRYIMLTALNIGVEQDTLDCHKLPPLSDHLAVEMLILTVEIAECEIHVGVLKDGLGRLQERILSVSGPSNKAIGIRTRLYKLQKQHSRILAILSTELESLETKLLAAKALLANQRNRAIPILGERGYGFG